MEKLSFNNKRVLITGASSGIGKAFAKELASQGANLIITARENDSLTIVADELQAIAPNICIKTIPADLSKPNEAKLLFLAIQNLGLCVDYLINNAGVGQFSEFQLSKFETYHNMLMLNINAVVELTHLFMPSMKKNNSGGIINVASTGAFQPLPYQAVYGASKAFVLSFSEALSGELLDTNVRVMALCPGVTKSNFMKNANADSANMKFACPDKVVISSLSAFAKNRVYTIIGRVNYVNSLIPRFISRKSAIKIVANMFKDSMLRN